MDGDRGERERETVGKGGGGWGGVSGSLYEFIKQKPFSIEKVRTILLTPTLCDKVRSVCSVSTSTNN